jgi:hypothetical protein
VSPRGIDPGNVLAPLAAARCRRRRITIHEILLLFDGESSIRAEPMAHRHEHERRLPPLLLLDRLDHRRALNALAHA